MTKSHIQSQKIKISLSKKIYKKNIYGCDKCIIFPSISSSPVSSFKCCELKCKHLQGTRDIWRSDEQDKKKCFIGEKKTLSTLFRGTWWINSWRKQRNAWRCAQLRLSLRITCGVLHSEDSELGGTFCLSLTWLASLLDHQSSTNRFRREGLVC